MEIGKQRRFLIDNYATTPNKVLSEKLGISEGLVRKRARLLGLKKDPKYLSDTNRRSALKSSVSKKWKVNKEAV